MRPVPAPPTAPPRRTWKAQAATLLGVWVVLVGVVVGIGQLITGPLRSTIDPPENDLARWFAGERTGTRSDVADFVTRFADTWTIVGLGAVIAVAVWLWRREARPTAFVVATVLGVFLLYMLTVTVDPRPRPPVKILDPGLEPDHSFPSGHTGAAIAVYGLLVVLAWTYAHRARWWVTPLLLIPPLVAVARLYEGAHHLSDVLASVLYGCVWLAATTTVLLPGGRHPPAEREPPDRRPGTPVR
jgi:membrane-associated phospholipid phosphatase